MASVHDVAAAILERAGTMSTMKLQKLVYYAKAWHGVWDEEVLFPERIEAWANGPVCRALYDQHRGSFSVTGWPEGDVKALSASELETVKIVTDSYEQMSGQKLSVLTHQEDPWADARKGLAPGARSNREITLQAMMDYYSSLDEDAVEIR